MLHDIPFTGNLTKDIELRFNENNKPFVQFSLAMDDRKGTEYEKTHFIPFTANGQLAKNLAASCKKGMPMLVIGRVDTYSKAVTIGDKDVNLSQVTFRAMQAGPSLVFATAEVTKNPYEDDNRRPAPAKEESAPAPAAKKETPAPAAKAAVSAGASSDFDDEF